MLRFITDSHSPYPYRLSLSFLSAVILLAWILPGLIGHQPWKPDEAYTTGLVLHVAETGDWVVPTLAGEPFMEKPPVYFITAAKLGQLLSPVLPFHDGARLATGLYMMLTFLFAGLAARELYGGRAFWVVPLLLAGCIGLPLRMHQMITDSALLTGFSIAFYGLCLGQRRPAYGGFWLGTGAGLGFMAKGILGPGIIGIAALVLPIVHHHWRRSFFVIMLYWAFAASLPWILIWPSALYYRSPSLFNEWFWTNNFGRFLGTNDLGPTKPPGYYLKELLWFSLPLWPLAFLACIHRIQKGFFTPSILLPLIYFVVILAVLSIAADARQLYMLPMVLPLAVLAVPGCLQLQSLGVKIFARSAMGIFGTAAVLLWAGCFVIATEQPGFLYLKLAQFWSGVRLEYFPLQVAVAAFFSVLWVAVVRWNTDSSIQALLNWSSGAALIWLLITTLYFPIMDQVKSYRAVFTELGRHLPEDVNCVTGGYLGEPQLAMLHYHNNLIIHRNRPEPQPEGCSYTIFQYRKNMEEVEVPEIPGWKIAWKARRPGDKKEFYVLYRRYFNGIDISN